MEGEAKLDSAVFRLTPTRTRCDLFIISNGKEEKIASGLLSPFLAHLKSAQDQIDKGSYSIILQTDNAVAAEWFTKGTVERFVRFVSTPEILERVNTIESEIQQIEEAITIQGTESLGLNAQVEVNQKRVVDSIEGGKPPPDNDANKAIVLYKPEDAPSQENGSNVEAENSKVKLMRVLETRRTILQKEQGMAFARAVAAGFVVDHVTHLVSFSKFFGAARLLVACVKFMELWKRKHESDQWFEIAGSESIRSELSLNFSGIVLSGANGDKNIEGNNEKKVPGYSQVSPHDHPHGVFQHPMFPQLSMQSPPGTTGFHSYHISGMPYYPNYASGNPNFHTSYNQMEDHRLNTERRLKKKKHSVDHRDIKDSSDDSDTEETCVSTIRSLDNSQTEVPGGKSSHEKISRSSKKKSSTVVIRNLNYITSNKHCESGSEQEPNSNSEMEEVSADCHRHEKGLSKSKHQITSTNTVHSKEGFQEQETDSENWNVFQSFLLRNEENRSLDSSMFSNEKGTLARQKHLGDRTDPIIQSDCNSTSISINKAVEFVTVNGRMISKNREIAADMELVSCSGSKMSNENQGNVNFQEIEGGRAECRLGNRDDFVIYGRNEKLYGESSLDLLADNGVNYSIHADKGSQLKIVDESFLVPLRSHFQDFSATTEGVLFADDVKSKIQTIRNTNDNIQNQTCYESNELNLMPERTTNIDPTGHDPTIYYDLEKHTTTVKGNKTQDDSLTKIKEGTKASKTKKSGSTAPSGRERKTTESAGRAKPSKLNTLAEAQARAEKLRAFKANLQKQKREKEEEEIKRLEALKRERQRRISSKVVSSSSQGTTPLQSRCQIPAKVSPSSHKGSKFSDVEPSSASPLQKFSIRRASTGSSVPHKVSTTSKLKNDRPSQSGLNRPLSSLKEDICTEDKKKLSVTRRLSDPKTVAIKSTVKSTGTVHGPKQRIQGFKGNHISQKADHVGKRNASEETQIKNLTAIINLDKSKSATLPELKITKPMIQKDVLHTKTDTEGIKTNRKEQLSQPSENFQGKNTLAKVSKSADGDEDIVIEKTVVMLEQERTMPLVSSQEMTSEFFRKEIKVESDSKMVSCLPHHPVKAPLKDSVKCIPPKQPNYKVVDDLQTPISKQESYHAPHARLSSMESISDLDHSGVLPVVTFEMVKNGPGTAESHLSSFAASTSVNPTPVIPEKSKVKEPKGLKRFLKFGKRSQNCTNEKPSIDRGVTSVEGHTTPSTSTSEGPSLKHLLAEEDSNTGSTPKASRSFSILSPFRMKSS